MDKLLFLAHAGDTTAAWAATELGRRLGAGRVVRATPEDLALAPRLSQRLEGERVDTRIALRDGTELASEELCLVLNRMRAISVPQFAAAHADDQSYASMELFALLVSWLASLRCPVVNPVSPRGLSEPGWHPLTWQRLAHRAGLPTREQLLTSSLRRVADRNLVPLERAWASAQHEDPFSRIGDRPEWLVAPAGETWARVLVIDRRAMGDAPPELRAASIRLASLAQLALLELSFGVSRSDPARWFFAGANPYPEITRRDELEALVEFLGAAGEREGRAAGARAAEALP